MAHLHLYICPYRTSSHLAVAASGGFFQIRPQKDFRPERGRNNILSLGLLSDLPEEILGTPPDPDTRTEPRNAYEFMKQRRTSEGDPTSRRWNASIRMSNFATLDVAPFAVGPTQPFPSLWMFACMNPRFHSWVRSELCSIISLGRKHSAI
jgi:hypothetical protein